MTTAHVYIATSLDGYIARPDGDIAWLHDLPSDGKEDYGYARMIASVDGIVMGRATFEKVLTFGDWPYTLPVVVLSRTLSADSVPEGLEGKVRVLSDTPRRLLDRLDDEGWRRAYIDGGKLIQSFLREGLVEDMIVSRIPVLLGQGLSLFGPLEADIKLTHVQTTSYPSGLVQSEYRVVR